MGGVKREGGGENRLVTKERQFCQEAELRSKGKRKRAKENVREGVFNVVP